MVPDLHPNPERESFLHLHEILEKSETIWKTGPVEIGFGVAAARVEKIIAVQQFGGVVAEAQTLSPKTSQEQEKESGGEFALEEKNLAP